ncbi:NTF2-related export protein 1 [Patella vulgata]|uniref:NTF2-related export protein 1 n=1 Tax=Patella vulgata TaxID=6465 RepID=UPI00218042A4|nr:NTF2-related export protein 1 [Patella vulgata]
MAPGEDFRARVELASQAGEEFYQLFYDTVDKKRHLLKKLYEESATCVWNGNTFKGATDIVQFYESLPITQHNITSINAVPLLESLTPGQTTIVVTVFGTVKYDKQTKSFYQNFTLSSHSTVWKIISDVFRFLNQ